jgi:kumamolisin
MSLAASSARTVIEQSDRPSEEGYTRTRYRDLDQEVEVSVYVQPRTPFPSDDDTFELGLMPIGKRRHMTLKRWNERYGATLEAIKAVEKYARKHGLRVVGESSDLHRRVGLAGSVGSLNRAFGTRLAHYRMDRGAADADRLGFAPSYLGRTGDLSVDDPRIGPLIRTVLGLDARPERQAPPGAAPGSNWSHSPPASTTHSPREVAAIYNFPTGLEGDGQTVALIEMDSGYDLENDLDPYFAGLGLSTPKLVDVSVNGARNQFEGGLDNAEVALDLQIVGAIAPEATLAVYFTHQANPSNRDYVDAMSAAVFDKEQCPSVISTSWGLPEENWTTPEMNSMHDILKAAAWLGITVCAATGDSGYSDLSGMGEVRVRGVPPHVDHPGSSPFVLACGGTSLQRKHGGIHEVVWVDTGGGFSNWFPIPRWQYEVANYRARHPSFVPDSGATGRGVPDVSGLADPNVGYRTRWGRRMHQDGGTSAVAPLWAALVALLNQDLSETKEFPPRAGYLNPLLYQSVFPAGFNSVIDGSNGYPSTTGWDPCTGYGSPNGLRLISALKRKA